MAITLSKDSAAKLKQSLIRFFDEELDQEIGEMKATLVLDYMLAEVGPVVYNLAVHDAAQYFADRLGDLEATCYEKEFTYWSQKSKPKR